jgi:outer membrane protein assembly factor BamB
MYVTISNSDESLIAFDLRTGKTLWRKRYGDIEVSPLLSSGRLYVGNLHGEFLCIGSKDGEQVWKFQIPDNRRLKGIRSTPALEDTSVVFGCDDGFVYALSTASGKERWRYDTGGPVESSVSVSSGVVYAGSLDGRMVAIDLNTGRELWRAGVGSGIRGGVALSDELIVVPTVGGRLTGLDRHTGTRAWSADLGSVINSTPVISGHYAYVGTLRKVLYGVDISNGSIVFQQVVEGRIKTAPAVAFGKLFIATDERWVLAFEGEAK